MQRYGPGLGADRRRRPERLRGPGGQPERGRRPRDHPDRSTARSSRPAPTVRSSSRPRTGTRRATPHFAKDGGIWPVHCVADTWGAELHPDLALPDDAPRVRKGINGEDGYSGLHDARSGDRRDAPTELDGLLRDAGVERVVVVGLATDYCVNATALDAIAPRLRTDRPDRRHRRRRPQAGRRRAGLDAMLEAAGVAIVADGDAMIRGALRLALVGAGISYAIDRVLAKQSERRRTRADQSRWSSSTRRSSASGRPSPTSRASRAGCTT